MVTCLNTVSVQSGSIWTVVKTSPCQPYSRVFLGTVQVAIPVINALHLAALTLYMVHQSMDV